MALLEAGASGGVIPPVDEDAGLAEQLLGADGVLRALRPRRRGGGGEDERRAKRRSAFACREAHSCRSLVKPADGVAGGATRGGRGGRRRGGAVAADAIAGAG